MVQNCACHAGEQETCRNVPKATTPSPEMYVKILRVLANAKSNGPPKVVTSKVIFPFLLEITEIIVTTSFTKLIRDLFLTVIMIFDILLCNSIGTLHFFKKSLPFVCELPHCNQTILLNIYLNSNNIK